MNRRFILVSGGTGFIGSRLALTLADEGHRVRVFGLENTEGELQNRKVLEGLGVDVVLGSVTARTDVEKAMRDVALVIHLAAAQHEMGVPDRHFRDVNVGGTTHIVESAAAAGVERLVHGSTIGVYGDPEGPVDESSPTAPVNVYGETKLEAEGVVRAARSRLHVTVARIPEVYGPGDRRLLKLFRLVQRGRFPFIGAGRNLHHPLYIDDLVRSIQAMARGPQPSGETLLLAGPDIVDTSEMVAAVAEAVGERPPRLRLPMWPFLGAAVVLEAICRPLGLQPPLHRRRLDFFRKSFSLSGERSQRILGFEPRVGFHEGARRTAAWYARQGWIDPLPAPSETADR